MTQDLLLKAGSIVLLLGGLIFVHELGHFAVAKALGVKVLRFSIGFGPRLAGFTLGETEYRIAALPLGGYVKMAGDDPAELPRPEDRGRGFLEQGPGRRFLIAAAGPAANLLLPVALYFAVGLLQNGKPVPGPVIGAVAPGSPAQNAGLRPGDRILSVAPSAGPARPIRWFSDLRDAVSPHPGVPLTLELERDGARIAPVVVTPSAEREANPIEVTVRGVIGVTPAYAPALVAPVASGAAGPLLPLDLVVKAAGRPVRHIGELERALAAAGCAPVELEVLRERALSVPGAAVSTWEPVALGPVPTCAAGARSIEPADPTLATVVGEVAPGSPAAAAGLRRGDALRAVNGKPVRSFRDVNALAGEFKAGEAVRLLLADGRQVSLVPAEQQVRDDGTGEPGRRLVLGFFPPQRSAIQGQALLASQVPLRIGLGEAAAQATGHLWEVIRLTVLGIAKIVRGDISFRTVGGPIMLFSIAAQAAEEGFESFLFKMALVSANLGLMNLLPIPVLDGGHLAGCALEAITRRRVSVRVREIANLVGLVLLALLMIAVFKNDIARLMG
ncbi:MAG TPA: site-2 protease family protein [Anaeromyxobacteraceae bacterium]|jgi:regulator of sigma E protease